MARTKQTKNSSAKKVATKVTKRAIKKAVKKTVRAAVPKKATKETKKTTKASKKTVKKSARTIVRKKITAEQTVREARYGGHQNTMPTNPKAPGRLLNTTITLSLFGTTQASNTIDALAITIARLGGLSIMVVGLFFTWNIFNTIVSLPEIPAVASVIESTPLTPQITVVSGDIHTSPVPVVITAEGAVSAVIGFINDTGEKVILGNAEQKAAHTWEYIVTPNELNPGTYTAFAVISEPRESYMLMAHEQTIVVPLDNDVISTTLQSASTTSVDSSSNFEDIASSSSASSSEMSLLEEEDQFGSSVDDTETMPLLTVPQPVALAPVGDGEALVIGTGTPEQIIELLLLRTNFRATTTAQANGWWSLQIPQPTVSDTYELYAQATPEFLSGPLDFSVISGRLYREAPTGDTQITNVATSDPQTDSWLWYLVASVSVVTIGLLLLLIGHYMHHTRPQRQELVETGSTVS